MPYEPCSVCHMPCLPYAMFAIVAIAKIQGKIFKLCILKAIYSLEYSGYMFKEQYQISLDYLNKDLCNEFGYMVIFFSPSYAWEVDNFTVVLLTTCIHFVLGCFKIWKWARDLWVQYSSRMGKRKSKKTICSIIKQSKFVILAVWKSQKKNLGSNFSWTIFLKKCIAMLISPLRCELGWWCYYVSLIWPLV